MSRARAEDAAIAAAACPLCARRGAQLHCDLRRQLVAARLLRCRGCGFLYVHGASARGDADDDAPTLRDPWATDPVRETEQLLDGIPGAHGRLLDVGAGFGDRLRVALARGFDAEGIEANESYAARARGRGLRVHHQPIETLGSADGSAVGPYQVVLLIDPLRRMADPIALLRGAAKVLAPGGVIALATPNRDATAARWADRLQRYGLGGPARGLYDSPHRGYLGPAQLRRALELAQLKLDRIVPVARDAAHASGPDHRLGALLLTVAETIGRRGGTPYRLHAYAERPADG